MGMQAASPFSKAETLEAILKEEVGTLRSILAATEAFAAGLAPVDFEALEDAVAARARGLERLGELEERAEALRGSAFTPPVSLAADLDRMRELSQSIQDADARAREATSGALEGARRGLRSVVEGRQVLRGYRSPLAGPPRFADRRG